MRVIALQSGSNGNCIYVEADGARLLLDAGLSGIQVERFIRSIKDESLSRMILFGEKMLCSAVGQYLPHYHAERNHQSLDNKIIHPGDEVGRHEGDIECRERLGGILPYYHGQAA